MKYSKIANGLKDRSLSLLFILICFASLSACGKRGPLYIPVEPEPVVIINESVDVEKPKKAVTQTVTPEESANLKKTTKKLSE